MRTEDGTLQAWAPMGSIPAWVEELCSAGGAGAGVCAVFERSGWAEISPGLRLALRAD